MNTPVSQRPTHWTQCRGWSAQRIRKAFSRNAICVDSRSIASHLGIEIIEEITDSFSGCALIQDGHAQIHLRASDHSLRKNFAVAHELGHILLHSTEDYHSIEFRDSNFTSGDPVKEAEANRFARDLLMPVEWIREFRRIGFDSAAMAKQFGVSQSALDVRLGQLLAQRRK